MDRLMGHQSSVLDSPLIHYSRMHDAVVS